MKKIIAFALVLLVVALPLVSCKKKDANTFVVGMECDYAPFNWTQADESDIAVKIDGVNGYADGYDVRIAQMIADGLGKKLVIKKIEWDGLSLALESGKIDAIIAGMSPTAERALTIDFTDPYYKSDLVIVVKKESAFADAASLADFSGAKITAQINTWHYTVIDQIDGVNKQTAMDTFPAMIVALQSGKIDGYISERPGAISAMTANSDLTFVDFAEGQGFETNPEDTTVAVGLKKGSDLVDDINEILAGISQDKREEIMGAALADQPISE